jgi:catechol 2,3-dioxygenase-like lactoylglutathione lyase family enzyme
LITSSRYVHTNLIAQDWRLLAKFYQDVFGCTPVPPERDYRGEELDRGTGLKGTHLTGVHLRLPGYGDSGPTLEIFNYRDLLDRGTTGVNRPGYGHIAFSVGDVPSAREAVLRAGGGSVGEVVTLQTADGRRLTWCYVLDPEGNMLELQAWAA